MRKVALMVLIVSILGIIFCELMVSSFNCEEVIGKITSVKEDTIAIPYSNNGKHIRYEGKALYDIEVEVDNEVYDMSFQSDDYQEEIKIGNEIKVIKYSVEDNVKLSISKSSIRNTETPIILFIIGIIAGLIMFGMSFLYYESKENDKKVVV